MAEIHEPEISTTGSTYTEPTASPTAQDRAAAVTDQATTEASNVKDSAVQAAVEVKDQAKEQLADIAQQAKSEARTLTTEARGRLEAQADGTTKQVASTVAEIGQELRTLADRSDRPDGPATEVIRQLADRTERFASRLEAVGYRGIALRDARRPDPAGVRSGDLRAAARRPRSREGVMATNPTTGPTRPLSNQSVDGPAGGIDLDASSNDASLGTLISQTTSDLSDLLRSEVELAKVELKEEATTIGKAGAMMGAAGLTGYLAVTLLCFAAAWGLSEIVPEGVAFLIVGVIVAAVAGVLYLMGRKRLENFEPVPRQTVETLQEDVQWAKQLKS